MVDVNTQNKTISVNVSSSGVSSNVNASGDTTLYYSNKAREWAISNRIVDGVDYSSKYYAGRANQSALNAQSFAQSAQNSYNNFQDSVDGALSTVNDTVQGAITTIDTKSGEAIETINNSVDGVIEDIEAEANEQIANIERTGFYMRDDKLYFINSKGEEEEFKSGGAGLEIGDIGIAPLGIDETQGKRRYLNGQIIVQDQYTVFSEKVKNAINLYPTLGCTEQEWQTIATMSVGGQVGKFVVDNEGGTIRLPKIIMPIQGLTDLSKLGEIVEAGLPNITGSTAFEGVGKSDNQSFTNSGALYLTYNSQYTGVAVNSAIRGTTIKIDASRSNPIYGNSDTVQQEQIQYPYFIQVATGAETEDNIINEIELNNPYTLFDSKYSPNALYNASWLKSEGQYNSGAVYVTCYEGLLVEYNTDVEVGTTTTLPSGTEYTKKGLSVKLSTEEYTDYDFVLNTAEETFRLPLLNGSESLPGDRYIELTLQASKTVYTAPANGLVMFSKLITQAGQAITMGVVKDASLGDNKSNRITHVASNNSANVGTAECILLPVSRGDLYHVSYSTGGNTNFFRFIYNKGNGSLYYYVGETVQNANLINAGRIEEKLATVIPDSSSLIASYAMPSDKYIDLTVGASGTEYTAPADGYFCFLGTVSSSGHSIALTNLTNGLRSFIRIPGSNSAVFLPCKKNDVITLSYNSISGASLRFIYAQGSESEVN